MNHRQACSTSVLLTAALLLLFTTPAFAQNGYTFMLRPDPGVSPSNNESYFVYGDLAPGTVVDDAVQVINTGAQPLDLLIYPADAVTAANGGIAFPTGYGETPTRAGAWIELAESEIHLQPGEVRSIPFRLTIPPDVRGEIVAGIVAQPAVTPEGEGQFAITVVQRVAVTLLATVQGAEPLHASMEIDTLRADTNGDQQLVLAILRNSGDLGLRPSGALQIQDFGGKQVYRRDLSLSYFLAGDTVEYSIPVEPPLPAGEYQVTLQLAYDGGQVERTMRLTLSEPTFQGRVVEVQPTVIPQAGPAGAGASPLLLIALGIIILLLVVLVILQTIRLRRVHHDE